MYNPYEHAIVITNRTLVQGSFLEQMEKVVCLHPQGVILRERDLSEEEYEVLAEKVMGICAREKVSCFLHSRIPIARKLGCTDIHLSIPYVQSMSETEREELRRNFAQVSISCHSMEDMELAVQAGASQIILGTIFETDCKKGLQGKGVEFVRQICARCPVPVYAIGGMNLERISLVRQAGAAGGCMMSGFMKL